MKKNLVIGVLVVVVIAIAWVMYKRYKGKMAPVLPPMAPVVPPASPVLPPVRPSAAAY